MKKNQSVGEVAKIYYKLCKSAGTWIYIAGNIGASFLFYQARDPWTKRRKKVLNRSWIFIKSSQSFAKVS